MANLEANDFSPWQGSPIIIRELARHLMSLKFGDVPDYDTFITELKNQEDMCRQVALN